jgi:Polysaccharide lyase
MKRFAALLALTFFIVAEPVFAAVDYKNGFEMGTINDAQNVFNPDQWSFVTTPKAAFELQSAAVEIKNGVHPSYDDKKESLRSTFDVRPNQFGFEPGVAFEGREQFYAFSFRYAATNVYHPTAEYIVMFWESISPFEQPLQLTLKDGTMRLRTNDSTGSKDVWTAQVSADAWHRFAMKVKFSEDPAVGSVTFYVDNVMVVNDAKYSNIRRTSGGMPVQNQMVFGFLLFQPQIVNDPNAKAIAFFDEIRAGSTLDDVTPIVPVVDAGVPDSGVPDSGIPPKPDAGVADSGAGGGSGGGGAGGGGKPPAGGGGGNGGGMAQAGGGVASGAGGENGMPPGPGVTTGVRSSDTSCGCNSSPMATFVLYAGLMAALRRRRGSDR